MAQTPQTPDGATTLFSLPTGQSHSELRTTQQRIRPITTEPKALSVEVDLGASQGLQKRSDYEFTSSYGVSIAPSYKISDLLTASALLSLSKDLGPEKDQTILSNSIVALGFKPLIINQVLSSGFSIGGILPTDKVDNDQNIYQGSINLADKILYSLKPLGLPVAGYYSLTSQRNFHAYTTDRDGSENVEYSLGHALTFDVPIAGPLSYSQLFAYTSGWTYDRIMRGKFEISETLFYIFDKSFKLYIGHTNAGDARESDQETMNVKLFDANESTVRGGLVYAY